MAMSVASCFMQKIGVSAVEVGDGVSYTEG